MATTTITDERAGTPLATAPRVADARMPETWRGRRSLFLLAEKRAMPRWVFAIGALVQIATIGILAAAGYPTWRVVGIGVLYAAFATMQQSVARREVDERCLDALFIMVNVGAQLFVVGSATLTGGVYSPFLPTIMLPAIVSLFFFGPIPASRWIAVANGCLIVAMIALPEGIVGPPLDALPYTAGVLLGLGWSLFMLHMMAGKLANAASKADDSFACLREERVVEAEAQLRRLQSVGAKVAHELKNPLAAIKGLVQLVARAPESERTQERLAVVASEIARMETILAEYLSFSRPLEDLRPQAIELCGLARDVCDVLAGRADQAGVQLALDGDPTEVTGDPRRLKEALINLVANAIEATPSGGRVHLRITRKAGSCQIEVVDTGRGIAEADLERLGTSFFTTRPNGTGLGVVLAQGVIAQHGGKLAYASTVGRGTTATITLPAVGAAAPEPSPRAAMVEARA